MTHKKKGSVQTAFIIERNTWPAVMSVRGPVDLSHGHAQGDFGTCRLISAGSVMTYENTIFIFDEE